jgi:diguanylate cyclase (GGDEF)-like protein
MPGAAVAQIDWSSGLDQDADVVDRRPKSLRREWTRAFAIMLLILLAAAIFPIVGAEQIETKLNVEAVHLQTQSAAISGLRADVVVNAQLGHQLLSQEPVIRAALAQQELQVQGRFQTVLAAFSTNSAARAAISSARSSWQDGLSQFGLWGDEVLTFRGNHSAQNLAFGVATDATLAKVDGLEIPTLKAMDVALARSSQLARTLVLVLIGLFGLAVVTTLYFLRRMARDLMRPVVSLHQGVMKLQAGDFDHRITVSRLDELGELAAAFNSMAGALDQNHQTLTSRATHDSLTGLLNRAGLVEQLAQTFSVPSRRRNRSECLLFIDVDDFKNVNDSLGHEAGDALLIDLAGRLSMCVREEDVVARLGGDEFAILASDDLDGVSGVVIAERILSELRRPFDIVDHQVHVAVSIGVAPRRADTLDAAQFLREADFAMYMAKGTGKACYQTFDVQMHDRMAERVALKTDLASATALGQLRLQYQPVFGLQSGSIVGFEALVRWEHPHLGLLSPGAFIGLAEETGDITAIGEWVLRTALRDANQMRRTYPEKSTWWVGVNLSTTQFTNDHTIQVIRSLLEDPDCDGGGLVLEITESAFAGDVDGAISTLHELRALGIRIAIDDFGTGFSSLSSLINLPVDILKIDRSFVSGELASDCSRSILDSILDLAVKLDFDVIAEGIETPAQFDYLRDRGCQMGQGFLLGHPMDRQELGHLHSTV